LVSYPDVETSELMNTYTLCNVTVREDSIVGGVSNGREALGCRRNEEYGKECAVE
jgi:hypothetical protein